MFLAEDFSCDAIGQVGNFDNVAGSGSSLVSEIEMEYGYYFFTYSVISLSFPSPLASLQLIKDGSVGTGILSTPYCSNSSNKRLIFILNDSNLVLKVLAR